MRWRHRLPVSPCATAVEQGTQKQGALYAAPGFLSSLGNRSYFPERSDEAFRKAAGIVGAIA